MDLAKVVLETHRLKLIPISLDYKEQIFKEFTGEIATFMAPKPSEKIEETEAFINHSVQKINEGRDLVIVLLNKETGEFLGCGGLHRINTKTPEPGIWLKKSAQGHGYGKEAVTALYNWAMENVDFDYLMYPVDRRNIPSRKIPESLGGIIEYEYKHMGAAGNELDTVEYRLYKK